MDFEGYAEAVRLLPKQLPSGPKAAQITNGLQIQKYSMWLTLVCLGFMYSAHNLIAPNMTAIANLFHFNKYERDEYIGGELTLFLYFPGVLGALLSGILSGFCCRRTLFAGLTLVTALACWMTAWVHSFHQLAWCRLVTGFGIGSALPVIYSLVGDWFPASKRAGATALVTASSGAGVFMGQCIAATVGAYDWRWPFIVIAVPSAFMGAVIFYFAEEPVRGGQEDAVEALYQHTGLQYVPVFTARYLRSIIKNRTNLLVILQAFPGNIPWGVIIVYLHDFLIQDLGLSAHHALAAISALAGSAFLGILIGGYVGQALYGANSRYLGLFGGVCNILRAVPFYILFGWKRIVGPLDVAGGPAGPTLFFLLLGVGGFIASLSSACSGAMLLNVNLPETRGSIVAMYSVLDDVSKGFGTLFVAMIIPFVGGRAFAYQLSLILWVVTGAAFLLTYRTYDEDENQMKKNLDEAAMESMVHLSKQRASQAVKEHAKAAGQTHYSQSKCTTYVTHREPSKLRWKPEGGTSSKDTRTFTNISRPASSV